MIYTPTKEDLKRKFESLKPRDLEEYMGYVFWEEEPENVGDKDTFDENLWDWIGGLQPGDIMEYAYKYDRKTF